jgi:hypothetical protein
MPDMTCLVFGKQNDEPCDEERSKQSSCTRQINMTGLVNISSSSEHSNTLKTLQIPAFFKLPLRFSLQPTKCAEKRKISYDTFMSDTCKLQVFCVF